MRLKDFIHIIQGEAPGVFDTMPLKFFINTTELDVALVIVNENGIQIELERK